MISVVVLSKREAYIFHLYICQAFSYDGAREIYAALP